MSCGLLKKKIKITLKKNNFQNIKIQEVMKNLQTINTKIMKKILMFLLLITGVGFGQPNFNTQVLNELSWNYNNLLPFETRTINLTFNLNSPMEIPALNSGDILNFLTSIFPIANDEMPADNVANFEQIMVNSFDPNNKTCLEGNFVSPTKIGGYLHYNINF